MTSSSTRNVAGDGSSDEYTMTLYKTEMCRSFSESGYCRYGVKCRFAHGSVDLRPVHRHKKYKTERCNNFIRTGNCPYAGRCRFIHETSPSHLGALISPSNRSNSSSPSRSPSNFGNGGGGQFDTFHPRSRHHGNSAQRTAHSQSAHLKPQTATQYSNITDSPLILSSSVPATDSFGTASLLSQLSANDAEYQAQAPSLLTSLSYSAFDSRLFPVRSASDGFDPNRRAYADDDGERYRHAHFAQERHAQSSQRLFDPLDVRHSNRTHSALSAETMSIPIPTAHAAMDESHYFEQRHQHSRSSERRTVHDVTAAADFDDDTLHSFHARTFIFPADDHERAFIDAASIDRLSGADDERVDFALDVESLAIHSAEQTALTASHAFLTPSPSPALEETTEEARSAQNNDGAAEMGGAPAMNIPFHFSSSVGASSARSSSANTVSSSPSSSVALDQVFGGRAPKSPFFNSNSPFTSQPVRVGADILTALSQRNGPRTNARTAADADDTLHPGELDLNDSFPHIQLEPFTARTTETSPSLSSLSSYSSHSSPSLSSSLSSVTSSISAYHFTHHTPLINAQHATQSVAQQPHCRKNT